MANTFGSPDMTGSALRHDLDIYTCEELAHMLNVKVTTLTNWRCTRRGPDFVKTGKLIFYRRSDVEKWLNANAETAARPPKAETAA